MSNDTIQEVINDTVDLAIHCKNPMTRLALEGIANRLQTLCDAGLYVTPKAALDAIDVNRARFEKYLSIPSLGIQFSRHKSAEMTHLVATGRNRFNDHIYEVRVVRDGNTANCGWRAMATNDGRLVFTLSTKQRSRCEHCALSAMKRYLKIGHRNTYRTLAKQNKEEK